MFTVLTKQIGASLLGGINLVLVIWAVVRYRSRQSIPDGFYKLLYGSLAVAAMQLFVGLYFVLGQGKVATGRHLFYGIMVGVGALVQLLLLPKLPLGTRYRGRPLVYAFWALFVLLATFRSWMSA